jgi:putative ABC transport system permease protein
MSLGLALRLARRELRGGASGFRVFVLCLALGVAAIATVQSLAQAVRRTIAEDGRSILGGDVSLRLLYSPAAPEQMAWLKGEAAGMSTVVETRAMARNPNGDEAALVELKAVDGAYPLFGALTLVEGGPVADAFAPRGGMPGAVVEDTVPARLRLAIGDRIAIGDGVFELRGLIAREPDRAGGGFTLGPRVMIAADALPVTGLIRPGSMLYYDYRLRLPDGGSPAAFKRAVDDRFPGASWRMRSADDAAPALTRMIDRLDMFLTLVGLTALLVGGVGVGNAVKAYLDGRVATIATLKALGASARLVFAIYLIQILVFTLLGIALGLGVGATAPVLLGGVIDGLLPVEARIGIAPGALGTAALYGLLTALAFMLWPLARAGRTPVAALFRDRVTPSSVRPGWLAATVTALLGVALAGLAVATASDWPFALIFVSAAAATFVLFLGAAELAMAAGRRVGRVRWPGLRLALANLHRPGAPTPQVVLSLGLGLTVLVAIALIQGNMGRQIAEDMPADAPSFFFIDIQKSQKAAFDAAIAAVPGGEIAEAVPNLRGRIVAVNGRPADTALVDPQYDWLLKGDRGVTYAADPVERGDVLSGAWWPADYDGPPLLSIYEDIGRALGIGVGDRMTVNVLGRDIEGEVANVRAIDWNRLGINFTIVFSPNPLSAAPHTWLATARVPPAAEVPLQRDFARAFPNVGIVRVKEALATAEELLARIGMAVEVAAGVTLAAGALVLAGVVAAGHRRRVYDAVVLKVLGATRRRVLAAFLIEFGLLGVLTATVAAILGTVAAWAALTFVMDLRWTFLPGAVAATAALCLALTVGFGFAGTWIALGRKAAPLLRND